MLRCTCCGRWTVEQVTLLDGHGRLKTFIRIKSGGAIWDEFTTAGAAETALIELGIHEYLVEVDD